MHISDLHFVKNAANYHMERALLQDVESVKAKLPGEKLLIVTGDFHNFGDEDYKRAGDFLNLLVDTMGLEMDQDVFIVPGNHDVGNDKSLDNALSKSDPSWKRHQKYCVRDLKEGSRERDLFNERLLAFRPYSDFVRSLHIYDEEPAASTDPDYPARVHVRCWRGKLNLLHLNTALVADGGPKDGQLADVDAAADPETWRAFAWDKLPALALGHNSFFDLSEVEGKPPLQIRTDLKTLFFTHYVSAYLCGDRHRVESDSDRQYIKLESVRKPNGLEIPNIVCPKSTADVNDNYSEFGYYWHDWDESTDQVVLRQQQWKSSFLTGVRAAGTEKETYPMRRAVSRPVEEVPPAPRAAPTAPDAIPGATAPDPLRAYLSALLERTRDAHPSFQLLKADEIDRQLFPGIQEKFDQIPARGSVGKDGPVSAVWDIVRGTWGKRSVRNVVIEGEGGIGKTTALFSLCNAEDAKDVPAVYVPMHQLLKEDGTLIGISDYLKGLNETYGGPTCTLASTPMGERPNLLVLLDGFNEVPQDKRPAMLNAVNAWYTNHPGAQLVAVSRPMDGLNLGKALAGKPLAVTLAPLEREVIRRYLKDYDREIPLENAPIWKVLCYPLFLTLYLKTGALEGKSSAGYPLAPKRADSGGALIWNFLQRELMQQDNEDWVLRCAVACEYLLPRIAWEMTERHSFVVDQDEAIQWTEEAMAELNAKALPKHLNTLFRKYERNHTKKWGTMPDFSGVDWPRTVLHDCGLLVPYQEEERDETGADGPARYALMHQNFRDCLAALHLLNAAEAAKRGLPRLWRRSLFSVVT